MSDRIDSYLSVLDRALRRQLQDDLRQSRIQEMRSHIAMSIQDLKAQGKSQDDAEQEALRNLGPAKFLAGDLIRQSRGYGHKSQWLLAMPPLLILLMLGAFSWTLSLTIPWASPEWASVLWWITKISAPLILVVFALRVWQTRRWIVTPIVIATLLLVFLPALALQIRSIPVRVGDTFVVYSAARKGEYRQQLQRSLSTEKSQLDEAERIYDLVQKGQHAPVQTDGAIVPNSNQVIRGAAVTGTFIPIRYQEQPMYSVGLAVGVKQPEADRRWKQDGAVAIADLRSTVEKLESMLANWQSPPQGYFLEFWIGSGLALATIAVHTLLLLCVNALILWIGTRARRGRDVSIA
jgi:hypothetical protein